MYEALGVNDIDKILIAPSSEDPVPKDPQENIDAMDNVQLRAFEGQDHDAHIMTHLTSARRHASGVAAVGYFVAKALDGTR